MWYVASNRYQAWWNSLFLYYESPMCLDIFHLMVDLEELFVAKILRKLDTNDAAIFEVSSLLETFHIQCRILRLLYLIPYMFKRRWSWYIMYELEEDRIKHTITLNYTDYANWGRHDILEIIWQKSNKVKNNFVANLIENVKDQSQKLTNIEFASGFDLEGRREKSTTIYYIKQLHLVYGQDYIHALSDYAKSSLENYHITINYPPKLNCNDGELVGESNSLRPVLNKTWLQFKESKASSSRMKQFWFHIRKEYSMNIPTLLICFSF